MMIILKYVNQYKVYFFVIKILFWLNLSTKQKYTEFHKTIQWNIGANEDSLLFDVADFNNFLGFLFIFYYD